MKTTSFSKHLTDFLTRFLPGERGASPNTVLSYKDTFLLLITFMKTVKSIPPERLDLKDINKDSVLAFLRWLQSERHSGDRTRNTRLTALHSFFRYIQYEDPAYLHMCGQVLSIPIKKTATATVTYLSLDAVKIILEGPDLTLKKGRRDLALLSIMYDTGARVQEIVDLTPAMVRLDRPCTVRLHGKGNKQRIVPMMDAQVGILRDYMSENNLLIPHAAQYPLFSNSRKEKLTRAGITHILSKYVLLAQQRKDGIINGTVTPHVIRHSKAMHLLQAGVNLVYIRDILGHVSIKTTEIYARTDSKKKREALESAYSEIKPENIPSWLGNNNLLEWLKEFGR
ncbi:site-specific integrase [Cyclobacterium plantarum]|uniref:site-specific integrase n=1 Tax=Cyclobacterium plantarum TaxID=2716263 RepID=UPI003F71E475